MSEANESVKCRIQERGRNEWIVRRVDEANKHLRMDASLDLGYECECGRSDQRGSMCRDVLVCIKEARVRRNLLKEEGIGAKWNTEKVKAFGSYDVRAPPTNEIERQRAQMHFFLTRLCYQLSAGNEAGLQRKEHSQL